MLCLIAILGGLLLMMGQHSRSESLFYYFRIEDHVPENHLLRLIDRHVSFDFVREQLRDSYSDTGRPSIDPEVLLRILLLGYLYGITSERKAGGRVAHAPGMALVHRAGLRPGDPAPLDVLEEPPRTVSGVESVSGAVRAHRRAVHRRGLVKGEHMSVDGSFIQANANHHSRIPREQLAEAAQVNTERGSTCGNWKRRTEMGSRCISRIRCRPRIRTRPTPPRQGRPAELGYFDNYLIDNQSCVIVGVQATSARLSQESAAGARHD